MPRKRSPFTRSLNIFPLLEGSEFDELVEDIRRHGVREPVWLYEGKILDGRNRYRAAAVAGVPCPTRIYEGDDPVAFVVSMNLKRRHLDESGRAMAAAKLATMRQGARTDLSPIGERSQAAAAELLNIGKRSVERGKFVLSEGSPELIEAVQAGELSVSGAVEQIRRGINTGVGCAPTPSVDMICTRRHLVPCMPSSRRRHCKAASGNAHAAPVPSRECSKEGGTGSLRLI